MLRHLQIQLGVRLLLLKREGKKKNWNPQSVWSSINQTGICSLLRRAQDSLLTASSQTAPFRPRVAVISAPHWRAAEEWDAEPCWCVASLGRNRIRGSQEWISAMKSHLEEDLTDSHMCEGPRRGGIEIVVEKTDRYRTSTSLVY